MRHLLILVGFSLLLTASTNAVACSEVVLPTSVVANARDIYVGYITALRSLDPQKWPAGAYQASITVTEPLKGKVLKLLTVQIPASCSMDSPHVDERVVVIRWNDGTSYVAGSSAAEQTIKTGLANDR
jgi:hypothetical protein